MVTPSLHFLKESNFCQNELLVQEFGEKNQASLEYVVPANTFPKSVMHMPMHS